jgi:uncharacterized protein (TIGR00251 family)
MKGSGYHAISRSPTLGLTTTSPNTGSFLRQSDEGAILTIYVQPKASKNEIVGVFEGSLKIRLSAMPAEGEANKECLKFLSKTLRLPKSDLEILKGHKSRRKTLLCKGASIETIEQLLKQQGI